MAKPRSRHGGAAPPGAPAPGASNKKSESGESEEARLFRAAVRDVTPLPTPAIPPLGTALPRPRPRARRRALEPETPRAAALDDVVAGDEAPGAAAPGASDPLSFRRPGVRDQTLRRLRRGRYPVEDELDLH